MARSRRNLFLLLALAPFVLLTARGRRLSPSLPRAMFAAAVTGIIVGVLAMVLLMPLLVNAPNWGMLVLFLLVILPAVMALGEAVMAGAVVSRRGGRFAARAGLALVGATIGHVLWGLAVLRVVADVEHELAIAALLIVPAALLGSAGAALGSVLVQPRS